MQKEIRPYLKINIGGQEMLALVDTSSTWTILELPSFPLLPKYSYFL